MVQKRSQLATLTVTARKGGRLKEDLQQGGSREDRAAERQQLHGKGEAAIPVATRPVVFVAQSRVLF